LWWKCWFCYVRVSYSWHFTCLRSVNICCSCSGNANSYPWAYKIREVNSGYTVLRVYTSVFMNGDTCVTACWVYLHTAYTPPFHSQIKQLKTIHSSPWASRWSFILQKEPKICEHNNPLVVIKEGVTSSQESKRMCPLHFSDLISLFSNLISKLVKINGGSRTLCKDLIHLTLTPV
jgi:hypothetical protein